MKRIGGFLFILFFVCGVCAKETVSFSQNTVGQGQSVELIFSSDSPIITPPDLSSILADFSVAGQQTQTLSSVVNGNVSQSYQIIYNVLPRRTGQLTIENLSLNDQSLPAITLTVTKEQNADAIQNALKLTASVSKHTIYQGESFVYTMQLFDPIGISDGEFTPPTVPQANIQQLGKDELFTKMLNGRPVQVFQRQYLITLEQQGDYTLTPGLFQGLVSIRRGMKKNPVDLFEMGLLFDGIMAGQQRVFAHTKPLKIQVLPRPSDWEGWWLPSTDVVLTENYKIPSEIKKGSTIERTITLKAKGVQAEDLPQIIQTGSAGLNVYPSPEKRTNQHDNDTITGILNVSIVLVPTKAGELTIPGIQIPWFNTITGEKQLAQLPSKIISVAGIIESAPVKSVPPVQPQASSSYDRWVIWVSLFGGGILGGLIVAAIAYFAIKRKERLAKKEKPLPDLYPF